MPSVVVPERCRGQRLDVALAELASVARNQARRWLQAGRVRVDRQEGRKASSLLQGGERLEWEPPEPASSTLEAEAGEVVVLFDDPDLVVVDKQPGLVVHPGAGRRTGTLVHRLLHRYPEIERLPGPGRPGIVHRLDAGTSGVMVIARSERAYESLRRQFTARSVHKHYAALVYGRPREPEGRIEAAIARHPSERQRMAVRRAGRPATSLYRTLASAEGISFLLLRILTGRTHQIRVHLQSLGHPIVGDTTYGGAIWKAYPGERRALLSAAARPMLHAWSLAFGHPGDDRRIEVEAPLPADLRQLWTDVTGAEAPGRQAIDL